MSDLLQWDWSAASGPPLLLMLATVLVLGALDGGVVARATRLSRVVGYTAVGGVAAALGHRVAVPWQGVPDIRPKPEFGTIEVRVLDAPLTIEKAAALAAYIECLARWLRVQKPLRLDEDDYLPYTFNRFQACRFGLDATYVDPQSGLHSVLRGTGNDATWLRAIESRDHLLPDVVRQAARRWHGDD